MNVRLFQNEPIEHQVAFKRELLETNYKRIYYMLRLLMPVSLIMWVVSFAIQDDLNIQRTNLMLFASSIVLFAVSLKYPLNSSYSDHTSKKIIIYFTYAILLFWGTHLYGFHEDNSLLLLDMVLVIIVIAFMFLVSYQVLAGYYIANIAYLFVVTPYLEGAFNYPPKVVTPILLVVTAFFLSRIIFSQHMERFILEEKVKSRQEDLSSELMLTVEKLYETEQAIRTDVIKTLVKVLEYYDIYTRGHSENVSNLAQKIAQQMRLSNLVQDEVMVCGLVHDIGKIQVPVHILNKPDKLSKEEYEIIKQHSQYGCDMLMESSHLNRIAKIVLHHHEHWDGSGYPYGLKKDDIPIESQVLMVADAWDAMISERIYKKSKSIEEAKTELITHRGKQFSPDVVDAILEIV